MGIDRIDEQFTPWQSIQRNSAFKDIQVFQSQHIRIIKIFSKLNSDIFDEISPPSFPRSIPHKHIFELFSR